MPRTRSLAWSELKIGIAAVVALALLTVVVIAVGGEGGYSWQRYPLKTKFSHVQGLKPGAVVRVGGKEIGLVTGVDFVGTDIEVTFEVLKSVRPIITTTSTAQIGSLSLLGEPIIDVTAGKGGTPLEDNAYLTAAPPPSTFADLSTSANTTLAQMDQVIADIRAGRGTIGKIVTDDALYNEMQALMTSASNVTKALEAGQGTLGGLMKDPAAHNSLKASLANLETMTTRINSGQGALGRLLNEATARSISNTTSNLDQITGRMSRGEGTAGKLMTDQQLYDRLNAMAGRMDEVASGLAAGRGTAGQLLRDQALYENMNRAVVELRDLLGDIRKDPQKYLRVNVSIF